MNRKDPGQPTEEQHQDAESHEAVDGNHIIGEELVPGAHGAVPHENGHVEKHVNCWLEGVIQCLEAEPIVPCEGVACDKTSENTMFELVSLFFSMAQRRAKELGEQISRRTYSSLPIIPQVPVIKSASESAKTRKLSRSTNLCSSAPAHPVSRPSPHGSQGFGSEISLNSQCKSSFAIHPTVVPYTTLKRMV